MNQSSKIIEWVKNHWVTGAIVILVAIIVGAGQITDSIDKVITFKNKYIGKNQNSDDIALSEPAYISKPPILNTGSNKLNPDYKKRDQILKITTDWSSTRGGTYKFQDLTGDDLSLLIKGNFINLDERQNNSPSTKDFLGFLNQNPLFTVGGYAVSPSRLDYRVTITTLYPPDTNLTPDSVNHFLEFCQGADDINEYMVCWWD